jgi:hypothetical protein
LALVILLGTSVHASVGSVAALKGKAAVIRNNTALPAKVGLALQKDDQIKTDAKTKMQIIFSDETIITIGKNSHFAVNEYIADSSDQKADFSLFKGTMRTISGGIGKANPSKFKIKTKTATMGIRGTNFIVIASPTEGDTFACMNGAIFIEGKDGTLDVPKGYLAKVSPAGGIGELIEVTPKQLDALMAQGIHDPYREARAAPQQSRRSSTENQMAAEAMQVQLIDSLAVDTTTVDNSITDETILAAQTDTGSTNVTDTAQELLPTKLVTTPHSALIFFATNGYIYNFSTRTFTADIQYHPDSGVSALSTITGPSPMQFSILPTSTSGSFTDWDDYTASFASFSGVDPEPFYNLPGYTWELDESSANNYVKTIADNDPNDDIAWGTWSLPIIETLPSSSITQDGELRGYFVSGNITPSSVIQQLNGVVSYGSLSDGTADGLVTGTQYVDAGTTITLSTIDPSTSTVYLEFDFGAGNIDRFYLRLNSTAPLDTSIPGGISPASSSFSVNQSTIRMDGKFFGDQAGKAGGSFVYNPSAGTTYFQGAFQATKQ